jgi:3,4-dihydroxy 2-butanone 4-phosphate synthase/GTP cyclohydrolase II
MARRPELKCSPASGRRSARSDLIRHRLATEHGRAGGHRAIETDHGPFELQTYRDRLTRGLHYALVRGDVAGGNGAGRVQAQNPRRMRCTGGATISSRCWATCWR